MESDSAVARCALCDQPEDAPCGQGVCSRCLPAAQAFRGCGLYELMLMSSSETGTATDEKKKCTNRTPNPHRLTFFSGCCDHPYRIQAKTKKDGNYPESAVVPCAQRESGCRRTLPLEEIEAHLKVCGYVAVPCPCDCGLHVAKRQLAPHLAATCQRRLVACPFCLDEVVYAELDNHNDVCGERPVPCAHCMSEVKREQLATHEASCPSRTRNCPLSDAGCLFRGASEELQAHEDDVKSHVEVMAAAIAHCQLTVQNLERKHEEIVSENFFLNSQLKDIYAVLKTVKDLNETTTTLKAKVKKLEIAETTVEEMNETLARLKDYMQRMQPAVVQDHKSQSPQASPDSKAPPRGLFSHNSLEETRARHSAPPTDL